jgi:hypothetical protein
MTTGASSACKAIFTALLPPELLPSLARGRFPCFGGGGFDLDLASGVVRDPLGPILILSLKGDGEGKARCSFSYIITGDGGKGGTPVRHPFCCTGVTRPPLADL